MNPDLFGKPINCDPGPIRSQDKPSWSALNGTDLILIDVEAALHRAEESKPDTKDGRIQRRALINTLNAASTLTRNFIRAEGN